MKYRQVYEDLPILFISMNTSNRDIPDGNFKQIQRDELAAESTVVITEKEPIESNNKLDNLWRQLSSLGLLNESYCCDKFDSRKGCINEYANSMLISSNQASSVLTTYIRACLQFHIIQASATLSTLHNGCLRKFILYAFDMAREIQITPRRIKYAQRREIELYESLIEISNEKHEEILNIIQNAIQMLKISIGDHLDEYYLNG